MIFEFKDYTQTTVRFVRENGGSQYWDIKTKTSYSYDHKDRLDVVGIMNEKEEFLILELYDTLGNKMVSGGNGHFVFYYNNGHKRSEGYYYNGYEQGKHTSWYENGRRNEKGYYDKGLKVGDWKTWDENGNRIIKNEEKEKKKKAKELEEYFKGNSIIGLRFNEDLTDIDTTSTNGIDALIKVMNEKPSLIIDLNFFVADSCIDNKLPSWTDYVVGYILNKGIEGKRIYAKCYCNSVPIYKNDKLKRIRSTRRREKLHRRNQRVSWIEHKDINRY
jgi:hypothetical protein